MTVHTGTCLCGNIQYRANGKPAFPHLCSCRTCQLWSGAPTVAWVEFPIDGFSWTGPGGEPALHQSSAKTRRGFCAECGSTLCAIDDGYDRISVTMATLDDSSRIKLGKQHSFQDEAPFWWPLTAPRPDRK